MTDAIPITPNPSPAPTLDNLRLITARNLPGAQLVAQVRAAGFEVRSDGPTFTQTFDDLGNMFDVTLYVGECLRDGRWYGVATRTAASDDPTFIANARLVVEVAAIHKAAEGDD